MMNQNSNNQANLSISNLHITLGKTPILHNISLALDKAEIGCLLGTSGCGKTTLLRSIAGFITPTLGAIAIDDSLVSDNKNVLPVEQRHVGMVFQDFALFPHLTVLQNITFGLKTLKMSKSKQIERAEELLKLIELSDKAKHYPHQLSGGQQQRVALARALAPKPKVILLDEPFSSIDRNMRDSLAHKVRQILKQEQATTIMVTHDQTEAFAMADKIGVINQGKLLQWQDPHEIYYHPSERFVAEFIGESSFIEGKIIDDNRLDSALGILKSNSTLTSQELGNCKQILIRPDSILYDKESPIKATILHESFKGVSFIYLLQLSNGETISAQLNNQFASQLKLKLGDEIGISVADVRVSCF